MSLLLSRGVFHLYVIRTENRDGLIEFLKERKIGAGIHYPVPLHLQKAYAYLNYRVGDFPIAERTAAEVVSLPMFPQLTEDQQARVVKEILAFSSTVRQSPVGEHALMADSLKVS